MTEPRTYPLRIGAFAKIMVVGILSVMTLAGFAIPFADPAESSAPPALFAIFWFGILGVFWFQVLSFPQAIIHQADDTLVFKAPIRSRSVAIAELRAIEPVPNQFGMLRFRHTNGKVNVLNQFDGFHELITAIKTKNPDVELRGC